MAPQNKGRAPGKDAAHTARNDIATLPWQAQAVSYRPGVKNIAILDAAMAHIRSVNYPVGLRWVFYRLLQDSVLTSKDDYGMLKAIVAKARKSFHGDWRPDTLVDEGRNVNSGIEIVSAKEMLELLPHFVSVQSDIFADQEAVPFLLYESATSDGQFEHFARPFARSALRGDSSIPHKWTIAAHADYLAREHGKPVHVLYFGDHDAKGMQIPESTMTDVHAWIAPSTELRFTRVGINAEHAARFDLPEKVDKPHSYEWESLTSDQAEELILEGLRSVVNLAVIDECLASGKRESIALATKVSEALAGVAP